MAERVVDDLEVVQVEEQDHGRLGRHPVGPAAPSTRSANRLRFGEAGQRVVVGLVAQLFLETRELGQRLSSWPFSRATAAWLASVSSRRRSSSVNAVPSVSRLAIMHRADEVRLPAQRRHALPGGSSSALRSSAPGHVEERVQLHAAMRVNDGVVRIKQRTGSSSAARRPATLVSPSASSVSRRG